MTFGTESKWWFGGCSCCNGTATAAAPEVSRRSMLGGAAALALSGLTPLHARAQTPAKLTLIDVHHHLAPPAYIADLKKHQRGAPPTLEWTPEKSLVDMDSSGIATAVLSITTPGVWFGDGDDAGAATLARACNDYGAKLIADHGRLSAFSRRSRCRPSMPLSRRSNTRSTHSNSTGWACSRATATNGSAIPPSHR
jgi:6-methylsalicylate decarboxylase